MTVPSSYGYPGVYINEQLQGPAPSPSSVSPSVCAFAGEHWRGPSIAVRCNSWSDFQKYFGGFNPSTTPVLSNPYLAYAVFEFFANGGQVAWVYRITNSSAAGISASATLLDRQATPQQTITLTAGFLGHSGNVGTWGNNLYYAITTNPAGIGSFNLNIYYGGAAQTNLVEQWINLSMNKNDPRYFLNIINSATQGSLWVVATDLGDLASPPNNSPALSALVNNIPTPTQFSGGTDPTSPPSTADRTAVVTYGSTPTSSPFDNIPGILNMNLPAETTATVVDALITYAQNRPGTFAVIDTPSGQTPAGAVSYFNSLSPVSAYAAVYYPWVNAPNPAGSNLQTTITLPPGGFVLGQYVSTDTQFGVWVAPAGLRTVLTNVVSAERTFAPIDLTTLNSNNIDALRTRGNGQVVIWGARTMNQAYATKYVPIRRTLNFIETTLTTLLEFAIFQPNDSLLWSNISNICNTFLGGLYSRNAFPGTTPAASYYVICDNTNNTPQSIGQGVVNTTVGVALLFPAEFISLTIAQFQSSGTTTVATANP